jgi:glycerophosphoryl diester phosphodiesterase
VPLVQLVDASGAPYDLVAKGDPRTYRDLTTPAGPRDIAAYADGVGANKELVLPPRRGREHGSTERGRPRRAPAAEAFLDAGVDGVFSDNADVAVEARDDWLDEGAAARAG